jgi:hypothetical protein
MLATQKYLVAYNRIMETSFFQLLFIQELIRIKPISIKLLITNMETEIMGVRRNYEHLANK